MRWTITPVPKPRMTRSDRWKKRPCVQRYWDFCDKVKRSTIEIPAGGAKITFFVPMPKSWSERKKNAMFLKPCQSAFDLDNCCKALFDAVFDDDKHIYNVTLTKLWHRVGMIEIEV